MATNITKSVFPEFGGLLSTPREALMAAPIEAARTGGQTIDQALVGAISGAGEQFKQSVGGLFGQKPAAVAQQDRLAAIVQQVQAQGVDLATPEGQVALAQALSQFPEFLGMATAMRQQAAAQAQEAQLKQAQTTKAYAEAQKALTEKTPAALEQADRIRLAELQNQFGVEEGSRLFREERDAANARKATQVSLTVPQEADLIRQSQTATGDITKRTSSINRALTLNAQNSPFAGAAFKQEVASIFGDAQKAAVEINALANTGALDTRIANRVASFIEGKTTEVTKDDRDAVLKVLRGQNKDEYERTVAPFRAAVKDQEQARRLFPSFEERYGMPSGRKRRIPIPENKKANFIENKRYEKDGVMYLVQNGELVEE